MNVSVQLNYSHGYWETPANLKADIMFLHFMHSNTTIQPHTPVGIPHH